MDSFFVPDNQLDFHELGIMTEFEIEKILLEFLEDEYAAGSTSLLIITGKGRVVRPIVEKLLSKNNLIRKFKKAGYYNGQDGAFEVILKE